MEPKPIPERTPLEVRFLNLAEQLDTKTEPDLNLLDEYFTVGYWYSQQEAGKEGEEQKEWQHRASAFEQMKNGSYQREKWAYCLGRRKIFLEEAVQFQGEGKPNLAEAARQKANNWEALASCCRRMP